MVAARTPCPLRAKPVFHSQSSALKQIQSPQQEIVPDLEAREARCVLLPLRSDVPFLFQHPLSSWNMRKTTIDPPPAGAGDSEATCIHFQLSLWHILCSCLRATSERCPLPGLRLNTEAFFWDSSPSESDYIRRRCFQDRAKTHQWNLEQSSEKPVLRKGKIPCSSRLIACEQP